MSKSRPISEHGKAPQGAAGCRQMPLLRAGAAVLWALLIAASANGQPSYPLPPPDYGSRVSVERGVPDVIPSQAWPTSESVGPGVRVRLPVPQQMPDGTVAMEPNVELFESPSWRNGAGVGGGLPGEGLPPLPNLGTEDWSGQPLPSPYPAFSGESAEISTGSWIDGGCHDCLGVAAEPMFARGVGRLRGRFCDPCGPLAMLFSPANRSGDIGIGRGRLDFAPFEVESSQPLNSTRIRVDTVHGFPRPNRGEYFWASSMKGGPSDRGTDYQDLRFLLEMGGGSFSASTEIPIRMLDPDRAGNTAGMGDMNVATKLVLVDGKKWQMSHVFRTYMPTGAFKKGLGTGHVALEPGLLYRYRWRPTTYLHSEIKYNFPVGGDPDWSGQVLRYGIAYSHLVHETDAFAVIHTCEFMGYSFLDGYYSQEYWETGLDSSAGFDEKTRFEVDGDTAFQIFPGLRIVADTGCDFGLFEFGISGTFSMGNSSLYDGLLRFDFRWSY